VLGSFAGSGMALAGVLCVIWALTWAVGTLAGSGISATTLGAGLVNVWPLAMAFSGLAILAAGLLHRPATVTALATGTLLAIYVIGLVGRLADPLHGMRVISAFRYYGSAIQHGIDVSHVAVLACAAVLMAAAGAWLYERHDIL